MYYLPLDLETTGLDPDQDRICEVAWTILNEDFSQHMRDFRSYIPVPSLATWQRLAENDFVTAMHVASGLMDEMEAITHEVTEGIALSDIEDIILADIRAGLADDQPIALLGSSVHFDKLFIRKWMPRLHDRLHYRVFDTSTLEAFMEGVGYPKPADIKNPNPHRALEDIKEDIEIVRYYQNDIMGQLNNLAELDLMRPEPSRALPYSFGKVSDAQH